MIFEKIIDLGFLIFLHLFGRTPQKSQVYMIFEKYSNIFSKSQLEKIYEVAGNNKIN